MIGVALTMALFAFFCVLRGKLNTWGLQYVQLSGLRREGEKISCWQFFKVGFLVMAPAL